MLALILILFEGGLELRLKDAIRYSPGGTLLAFVSYGFTLGLVAFVVRQLLHMSWIDGVLVGAVLGSPVPQWFYQQLNKSVRPSQSKSP